MSGNAFFIWLDDIETDTNSNRESEIQKLALLRQAKFPIVPGFIITPHAYFHFMHENNLDHKIQQLLSTISVERPDSLMQGEQHIKKLFKETLLSEDFFEELEDFYSRLASEEVTVSLFETHANEKKHTTKHADSLEALSDQILNLWEEMFTSHALWHRHYNGHDHLKSPATLLIQKRIVGDKAGTVVTVEPNKHDKDKIVIITHHPHEYDTYVLSKKNLSIIDRKLHHKTKQPKLNHDELLTIAKMAKAIEKYLYFPQTITWAFKEDKLFIISITPFSTLPKKQPEQKKRLPVARGKGIASLIGTGYVTLIQSPSDLLLVKEHDVVVASKLSTKQINNLKKVRGIILETGHPQSGIVTLMHQRAIPSVIHVKNATKQFKNGYLITIHGGKGEIYPGGFQ